LLGIIFRVIATSMHLELERTWVGKLSLFVMIGVEFVLTAPWDRDPGLTPMRAMGFAWRAAFVLTVLPAAYLQGFLIQRELSRAKGEVKLREDF
jgi:hypothetical protein